MLNNSTDCEGIKVVILDIEGTTTPISFVADVLFPYIRSHLREYLSTYWSHVETKNDVQLLRELSTQDFKNNVPGVVQILEEHEEQDKVLESVINNVIWQMNQDRKTTALKNLQGHMWKSGYESKKLEGSVYQDVLDAFQEWKAAGIPVYIYSSGSIAAQKLLFGFSEHGDLLGYLSGHFDTTIGSKLEAGSYQNIFQTISQDKIKAQEVLFVTDNILEAEAADKFGMQTCLSDRPGNKPLPNDHKFAVVTSFKQIFTKFSFANK